MQKTLGIILIAIGTSAVAMAGTPAVPEIDATTAASGLAVLAGAVLIMRSRRKSNSK